MNLKTMVLAAAAAMSIVAMSSMAYAASDSNAIGVHDYDQGLDLMAYEHAIPTDLLLAVNLDDSCVMTVTPATKIDQPFGINALRSDKQAMISIRKMLGGDGGGAGDDEDGSAGGDGGPAPTPPAGGDEPGEGFHLDYGKLLG